MSKAIEITRFELSPEELRKLASKAPDGRVVRRLLGIAFLLEGKSREEAAMASGMDRQTLCDWVHRYRARSLQVDSAEAGPAVRVRGLQAGYAST